MVLKTLLVLTGLLYALANLAWCFAWTYQRGFRHGQSYEQYQVARTARRLTLKWNTAIEQARGKR